MSEITNHTEQTSPLREYIEKSHIGPQVPMPTENNGWEGTVQSTQKRTKKIVVFSVVLLSVLALILISKVLIPGIRYSKAGNALRNGEFDAAHEIYVSLNDYKDSSVMAKETLYQKAEKLENEEKYKEAFYIYRDLGSYKESKKNGNSALMLWVATAIGNGSTDEAKLISKEVKLTEDQKDLMYILLSGLLIFSEDSKTKEDYFYEKGKNGKATGETKCIKIFLHMLPSSYKDTAALQEIVDVLADNGIGRLYPEHEETMRKLWPNYAFVRELSAHDGAIASFLCGEWKCGDYYLTFYEEEKSIHSSYNLPFEEPKGTKYYDIEDLIYYFDDSSNKHLAKVFRFEILDYDMIQVFCYKNGNTYTLYR